MSTDVVLAETAWRDLDEIYEWISDRSDPETAQRYAARILQACATLSEYPNRGTPRDDLARNVRTIGFERRATVAYRVEGNAILVFRILHKGRDAGRALAP